VSFKRLIEKSYCLPVTRMLGHQDEHGDHDGQSNQRAGHKIGRLRRSCSFASLHRTKSYAGNPVTQLPARGVCRSPDLAAAHHYWSRGVPATAHGADECHGRGRARAFDLRLETLHRQQAALRVDGIEVTGFRLVL
jgi:hypothetical protein